MCAHTLSSCWAWVSDTRQPLRPSQTVKWWWYTLLSAIYSDIPLNQWLPFSLPLPRKETGKSASQYMFTKQAFLFPFLNHCLLILSILFMVIKLMFSSIYTGITSRFVQLPIDNLYSCLWTNKISKRQQPSSVLLGGTQNCIFYMTLLNTIFLGVRPSLGKIKLRPSFPSLSFRQ